MIEDEEDRKLFAAMALMGLLASGTGASTERSYFSEVAVEYADALIKALREVKPK